MSSTPGSTAMWSRRDGAWQAMTWREADARVRSIAHGLLTLGLEVEHCVVILADTSVEWILADLGIMSAGGATTTIFPASPLDDCAFILGDCQARIAFCDTSTQAEKLRQAQTDAETLEYIIVFQPDAPGSSPADERVISLAQLEERGRAHQQAHHETLSEIQRSLKPDHLATLMYTSGTTGRPKGVMLTHDAWVYEAEALDRLGVVSPADKQFLFLPLSHVLAKALELAFIRLGVPTAIDGSSERVMENLAKVRPTWVGAVPRIFEKARNRILMEAQDAGWAQYQLFRWAMRVGHRVSRLQQSGQRTPKRLALQHRAAERLVFSKIRARFGGRIRFLVSGGAPLPKDVAEFFHATGLLICEGYGLTESSAASCVNTPESYVFGSVGRPLPGCSIRIAADGEILLRSRGVMKGYHNMPEATAETLTEDGWLRTGDIGRILDSGHLEITDRKREIIVTASGKNIAPALFQNRLKTLSPWVSEVLLHGDRRNFCSALVTIDAERVGRWANDENISWRDHADLSAKREVRDLIQQAIDDVNRTLPSYEQVKKFAILPVAFTVEDGTLTPSLKVKRRVIEKKYRALLDGFYEGAIATPD